LGIDLFDRERRALLGGGLVLAAQCCGNLGYAILKLTVDIIERLRRRQRRQFVRLVPFRPAPQQSNRVADAGATIAAAADQLELRDQPVIAFQELIAFFGESLVEFFELVDPAFQASDFAFELVHGVCVFGVLAPQLGIALLKDFYQIVVIALQFLWHRTSLAVRANNGRLIAVKQDVDVVLRSCVSQF
jgi:hypothetical protein